MWILVPVERHLIISNDPRRQHPPAMGVKIKPLRYGITEVSSSLWLTQLINAIKEDQCSSFFEHAMQIVTSRSGSFIGWLKKASRRPSKFVTLRSDSSRNTIGTGRSQLPICSVQMSPVGRASSHTR